MDNLDSGQVSTEAADIYERFFMPALFAQWPERILERLAVRSGERVLDVACGTGAIARSAAERLGSTVAVTGLDINPGMLAVARRLCPGVEWRSGRAEALPLADASYDVVASQFGLMFFEDRVAALREMWRVLAPGGRLALAVWDALPSTPGYAAVVELLERLFGPEVARSLRAPFVLGDATELRELCERAGLAGVRVETLPGVARFASIDAWVHTDVRGWTLAEVLDDAQFQRLLEAARIELRRFARSDGSVEFAAPAHLALAAKRRSP